MNQRISHILECHPIANVNIVRADNYTLFSDDNKEYLDFESGIWCTSLGHVAKEINEVIIDQINRVIHLNTRLISPEAEKLALTLIDLVGLNNGKALFLSSGSEAVGLAISLACLLNPNRKILSFDSSYLSAYSYLREPRSNDQWVQINFSHCKNCNCSICPKSCPVISSVNFTEIGCFVFEPGSSTGTVCFAPPQLIRYISQQIHKHQGCIIANEVTTGFGKTGKHFGFQHYEVQPDIVAMGKALGNGYPISAVVMNYTIASEIEKRKFSYAQSHQNDPLGCRIANEVIHLFKTKKLIQRSKNLGDFLLECLKRINNPVIKEVRGRGLMCAVELNRSNITEAIYQSMLSKGFIIGTTPFANVLRFLPALTITKAAIVAMCQALEQSLNEIILID